MDRLTSSKGSMIEQVNLGQIPTSSFDRQNHNFLSGKLGKLIITRVDEVYPGDRITGNVAAVANFEPLAAPILGTMVMKQEAFYIPDSILWKNAHKFYTGKKDFNTPRPSVTPAAIYEAYKVLMPNLLSIYDLLDEFVNVNYVRSGRSTSLGFLTAFAPKIQSDLAALKTFANKYGVYDILYQPVFDLCVKYFGTSYLGLPDWNSKVGDALLTYSQLDPADTDDPSFSALVNALLDFYTELFEMFFGVSTQLDYIGWPVFDDWRTYFFKQVKGALYNWDGDFDNLTFPIDANMFSSIYLDWLPFRAAYVCWYWNYRDELLETDALDPESDSFLADSVGDDEVVLCTLLRVRCWYKDSFTTALTNTGDGNLNVPVAADDWRSGDTVITYYDENGNLVNTADKTSAVDAGALIARINVGGVEYSVPANYLQGAQAGSWSSSDTSQQDYYLSLDLFDRIKRLRSFVMKKLILGYEYDDVVWSSFRVKLSNVRMRIPELLGRSRDAVDMATLVNNTTTTEQIAGDKTATAWAKGNMLNINYFAEENGYYISFLTILPLQSYLGGMQRHWLKLEQFDKMWPEFATMGMDAVYNCELSAPRGKLSAAGLTDDAALTVFGYSGRYYDLKSRLDESHGRMRTDLRFITFSREFNMDNQPKLNYIFVHCWPRTDMFVTDDPNVDIIKTIDVHSALDWQRRLPVPSEYVN